ncbi:MAG TPA: TIGR02444 family protein [Bordetella sp.]
MIACTRLSIDGALWSYAERLYACPGVAGACLGLQDRAGVDVALLIAALYGAGRGCVVDGDFLQRLDAVSSALRREAVGPLRAARRRLKAHPLTARFAEVADFRERIKAVELRGEQVQLALMAQVIEQALEPALEKTAPATPAAPIGRDAYRRAGMAVLRHFTQGQAPERDEDAAAIQDIADAAAGAAAPDGRELPMP